MEFSEHREVAALNQRIRRVLSLSRAWGCHVGATGQNSDKPALPLSGRSGATGRAVLAPIFFDGIDLESLVRDELLLHAADTQRSAIAGPGGRLTPKAARVM